MMRRALALAHQAAEAGEVPVGAVVYCSDIVVSEARNDRESSLDPTGHAELLAIRRAAERLGRWRLNDCTMAVTLEPCTMCAGAMVNARLQRVVFGARDPKAGACGSLYLIPADRRLNHRVAVVEGVLERECGEVLTAFFRRRRADRAARFR